MSGGGVTQGKNAVLTNGTQKSQLVDAVTGEPMTVNTEGRGDVVQHSHVDQGSLHMHVDGLTAATYRYILIDISDTVNYPHSNTDYAHIEWVEVEVDGSAQATFQLNLGFLKDVDADNGDRYVVKHWSGTRTAGVSFREFVNMYPNGQRMRSESIATHMISVDDANYQTAGADLPSTLDPTTSDTPSGNGDVVLEVIVGAGTIDMAIEIGYHSH